MLTLVFYIDILQGGNMKNRLVYLGILILGLGFSTVSYAKVIDLYINTKGAAVISQNNNVPSSLTGENRTKFLDYLEDNDNAAVALGLGINFNVVGGLYLGIQYSYEGQYGDKEKDIDDDGADRKSYSTYVHQVLPTIGWQSPKFAKFMSLFVEAGVGVWDKTSIEKKKYQGNGRDMKVDVERSIYSAFGFNFQILDWFSMYVKHSLAYYKQKYSSNRAGLENVKIETKRDYFTLEFGPKFSF